VGSLWSLDLISYAFLSSTKPIHLMSLCPHSVGLLWPLDLVSWAFRVVFRLSNCWASCLGSITPKAILVVWALVFWCLLGTLASVGLSNPKGVGSAKPALN
jgi:hypothetical protein